MPNGWNRRDLAVGGRRGEGPESTHKRPSDAASVQNSKKNAPSEISLKKEDF
jgi:hypothetical protein